MPVSLQHTFGYLDYILSSKTKHAVHSPFLFDFTTKVLNAENGHADFEKIEQIRTEMLNSNAVIAVEDFGAVEKENYTKKLSAIVQSAGKNAKYCKLLYRIINYYQPQICIELGTNVGISSMYQSIALLPESYLFTVEGSSALSEIARHNLDKLGADNTQVVNAKFDDVLPNMLTQLKRIDFAFIDGNHAKTATIQYFEQLLPYCHSQTILIFDDINWSSGMQTAWHIIKDHPAVKATVDLYFMGIVFFNESLTKQEFTLRF